MSDTIYFFLFSAHDLAREQKVNYGDDIASALRAAKKKRWNILEEKRITQEIELQAYLNKLMEEDKRRYVSIFAGTLSLLLACHWLASCLQVNK